MRTRLQTVPTDLPHASLYLDDIEAITKILSEAVAESEAARSAEISALTKSSAPALQKEIKIVYQIGQDEMDSIDDLLSQGGSLIDFEVRVSAGKSYFPQCGLQFSWSSRPRLRSSGIGDPWKVYGKVREVFEKRRSVLKNLIDELPFSVKVGSWLFFMLAGYLFGIPLKGTAHTVWRVIDVSALVIYVCGLAILVIPSRVYFVRSHELSRAASEMRRKYALAAFIFVLGLASKALFDYLVARFLK